MMARERSKNTELYNILILQNFLHALDSLQKYCDIENDQGETRFNQYRLPITRPTIKTD